MYPWTNTKFIIVYPESLPWRYPQKILSYTGHAAHLSALIIHEQSCGVRSHGTLSYSIYLASMAPKLSFVCGDWVSIPLTESTHYGMFWVSDNFLKEMTYLCKSRTQGCYLMQIRNPFLSKKRTKWNKNNVRLVKCYAGNLCCVDKTRACLERCVYLSSDQLALKSNDWLIAWCSFHSKLVASHNMLVFQKQNT